MTEQNDDAPGQAGTRLWKPGESGNPAGRPKGARNKTTLALEKMLDGEAEAITRKVIERAKEGDMVAIRLCLDRLLPMRRDRHVFHLRFPRSNPQRVQSRSLPSCSTRWAPVS